MQLLEEYCKQILKMSLVYLHFILVELLRNIIMFFSLEIFSSLSNCLFLLQQLYALWLKSLGHDTVLVKIETSTPLNTAHLLYVYNTYVSMFWVYARNSLSVLFTHTNLVSSKCLSFRLLLVFRRVIAYERTINWTFLLSNIRRFKCASVIKNEKPLNFDFNRKMCYFLVYCFIKANMVLLSCSKNAKIATSANYRDKWKFPWKQSIWLFQKHTKSILVVMVLSHD